MRDRARGLIALVVVAVLGLGARTCAETSFLGLEYGPTERENRNLNAVDNMCHDLDRRTPLSEGAPGALIYRGSDGFQVTEDPGATTDGAGHLTTSCADDTNCWWGVKPVTTHPGPDADHAIFYKYIGAGAHSGCWFQKEAADARPEGIEGDVILLGNGGCSAGTTSTSTSTSSSTTSSTIFGATTTSSSSTSTSTSTSTSVTSTTSTTIAGLLARNCEGASGTVASFSFDEASGTRQAHNGGTSPVTGFPYCNPITSCYLPVSPSSGDPFNSQSEKQEGSASMVVSGDSWLECSTGSCESTFEPGTSNIYAGLYFEGANNNQGTHRLITAGSTSTHTGWFMNWLDASAPGGPYTPFGLIGGICNGTTCFDVGPTATSEYTSAKFWHAGFRYQQSGTNGSQGALTAQMLINGWPRGTATAVPSGLAAGSTPFQVAGSISAAFGFFDYLVVVRDVDVTNLWAAYLARCGLDGRACRCDGSTPTSYLACSPDGANAACGSAGICTGGFCTGRALGVCANGTTPCTGTADCGGAACNMAPLPNCNATCWSAAAPVTTTTTSVTTTTTTSVTTTTAGTGAALPDWSTDADWVAIYDGESSGNLGLNTAGSSSCGSNPTFCNLSATGIVSQDTTNVRVGAAAVSYASVNAYESVSDTTSGNVFGTTTGFLEIGGWQTDTSNGGGNYMLRKVRDTGGYGALHYGTPDNLLQCEADRSDHSGTWFQNSADNAWPSDSAYRFWGCKFDVATPAITPVIDGAFNGGGAITNIDLLGIGDFRLNNNFGGIAGTKDHVFVRKAATAMTAPQWCRVKSCGITGKQCTCNSTAYKACTVDADCNSCSGCSATAKCDTTGGANLCRGYNLGTCTLSDACNAASP